MIEVTAPNVPSADLEKMVDADIAEFEAWFQKTLNTDPLAPSERSIIKSYFWYKLKVKDAGTNQTPKVETSHGA